MNVLSSIWLGIKIIGQVLGIVAKDKDLNNTDEMKKRDLARKDAKLSDEIDKTIEERDTEKTRTLMGD